MLQELCLFHWRKKKERDVTYRQVWWPILGIRALHLPIQVHTHSSEHTHTPWTHTRRSGQLFMLRHPGSGWGFGALLKSTSVVVLKVERALDIHSPHQKSLPDRHSNLQPFDYESDSLTIRPRIPHNFIVDRCGNFSLWELFLHVTLLC